jgi:hypothetical protein
MDSGKLDKKMVQGNCFFLMEAITQETLKVIKMRVRESYIILMVIIILVNGRMIKLMDMEPMSHLAEGGIRAIGKMQKSMEPVNRFGKMEQYLRDNTNLIKKVGVENFSMEMVIDMWVNSSLIKKKVKV